MNRMVVGRIEEQFDRVLLYDKKNNSYHVITSQFEAVNISVGDVIEYEPYDFNFGFFVRRIN